MKKLAALLFTMAAMIASSAAFAGAMGTKPKTPNISDADMQKIQAQVQNGRAEQSVAGPTGPEGQVGPGTKSDETRKNPPAHWK